MVAKHAAPIVVQHQPVPVWSLGVCIVLKELVGAILRPAHVGTECSFLEINIHHEMNQLAQGEGFIQGFREWYLQMLCIPDRPLLIIAPGC